MYDRAPRVLSSPYGSTTPGVGPGTYYNAVKRTGGKITCVSTVTGRLSSRLSVNSTFCARTYLQVTYVIFDDPFPYISPQKAMLLSSPCQSVSLS